MTSDFSSGGRHFGSGRMQVDWAKSLYRPGFYYVSAWAPGFCMLGHYAVVDDFGDLVRVPE